MVSNKSFVCETCGYSSNRKYNLELHKRSPNTCEKKIKRQHIKDFPQDVNPSVDHAPQNVNPTPQNVNSSVDPTPQNVYFNNKNNFKCEFCNKDLSSFWNLKRHIITCKKADSLQCPTCKKTFTSRQGKYKHMKSVNCEFVLTEEQQRIKELEEVLKEKNKQLEEKDKQLYEEKSRPTTIYNTTTNNNYFDHSINYNNYDNLNLEHITKEDIKRLFKNCRMQYPELSEDLTRMILGSKENQCIYLPEGQKSNTCAVIKDGVEMRKPLIRVLMDLGVQTATLIRDSNVIVRNKKDIVNNQFWADNRNACGLNISDIEYMTDNDKEIVQRNKNIVLDMCDGKI